MEERGKTKNERRKTEGRKTMDEGGRTMEDGRWRTYDNLGVGKYVQYNKV